MTACRASVCLCMVWGCGFAFYVSVYGMRLWRYCILHAAAWVAFSAVAILRKKEAFPLEPVEDDGALGVRRAGCGGVVVFVVVGRWRVEWRPCFAAEEARCSGSEAHCRLWMECICRTHISLASQRVALRRLLRHRLSFGGGELLCLSSPPSSLKRKRPQCEESGGDCLRRILECAERPGCHRAIGYGNPLARRQQVDGLRPKRLSQRTENSPFFDLKKAATLLLAREAGVGTCANCLVILCMSFKRGMGNRSKWQSHRGK